MGVDKTGGNDSAVGIDLAVPSANVTTDVDDGLAIDGNIAGGCRGSGAVNDLTVANDEIVHG
jgi:hypothetical protein